MSTFAISCAQSGRFYTRITRYQASLYGCLLIVIYHWTSLAQESPHGPIRFECQTCHGPDSWTMRRDSPFNHAKSGFALEGGHKATTCESCHKELRFAKQKSDCVSCHTDVHKRELGDHCQRCHSPQSWKIPDMVQKHQQTRFPLLGRHASISCVSCHRAENARQYAGAPTSCVDCHRSDYMGAKNPSHVNAGFSTECEGCHEITAMRWSGGGFDHNRTSFPLTGAHVAVQCQSCHTNGNYQLVYNDCYQCHASDFAGTSNPNHVTGGFSHNCEQCHSTVNWSSTSFDHSTTNFPLTGAHIATQCQSCHTNGNYQLVYNDCYQCHVSNFNSATNPNHVVPSFSHDCVLCHSTVAWSPSTFAHDTQYFRIYSGKHRGQWSLCSQCHPSATDFNNFTCFNCHRHDQINEDPRHANVPGYSYSSPSCYNCHRNA